MKENFRRSVGLITLKVLLTFLIYMYLLLLGCRFISLKISTTINIFMITYCILLNSADRLLHLFQYICISSGSRWLLEDVLHDPGSTPVIANILSGGLTLFSPVLCDPLRTWDPQTTPVDSCLLEVSTISPPARQFP